MFRLSLFPPLEGPTERKVSLSGDIVFDQPVKSKPANKPNESAFKELIKGICFCFFTKRISNHSTCLSVCLVKQFGLACDLRRLEPFSWDKSSTTLYMYIYIYVCVKKKTTIGKNISDSIHLLFLV